MLIPTQYLIFKEKEGKRLLMQWYEVPVNKRTHPYDLGEWREVPLAPENFNGPPMGWKH